MKRETRTIVYDKTLGIEAYQFTGVAQPFPNHFHAHYVIGLVESGTRCMTCRNKTYLLGPGSVLLLNPGDNHGCVQSGGEGFSYRALNIPEDSMRRLSEAAGEQVVPVFTQSVVCEEALACSLRVVHEMLLRGAPEFEKEEQMLLMFALLLRHTAQPAAQDAPPGHEAVEKACVFMRRHFAGRVSLEEICRAAGLSKSTLLRAFTKAKGITPYRYLETIRIQQAAALLRRGVPTAQAALRAGFSDQSHFTNYFSSFIGVPPGVYRGLFLNRHAEKLHEDAVKFPPECGEKGEIP